MHRSIDISVPSAVSQPLLTELAQIDGVITLSVQRGESVKPSGDVITVVSLNTAADDVLLRVQGLSDHEIPVAVVTSTVDSLLSGPDQASIDSDHDQSSWEESETALRRHTRFNLNYVLTSLVGAVLVVCAFATPSESTQAVALVAAAIITPSFEPLARMALAMTLRHRANFSRSLQSAALGYGTIIVGALIMVLVLRAGNHHFMPEILGNRSFHEVHHPPLSNLLLSAGGAVAGVVMVAAGRFTALAGALVALQLLPALVACGAAIEFAHWGLAISCLGRFGIDVSMVLIAGCVWFTYRHLSAHLRRPTLH